VDAQAGLDPCWSQNHYVGFAVTRLIYLSIPAHVLIIYQKKLDISGFEKISYFNVYNNTQDKNVCRKKSAHLPS
jgi:hypothetical protein